MIEIDAAQAALNGIPVVNIPANLLGALSSGRRMASILGDVVMLRRGPGRLTPQEYFYYRLWDPALAAAEKRKFVGKQAQHPMHMACNHTRWYATAADKLLFHTVITGAGLPTPTLLGTTGSNRGPTGVPNLGNVALVANFLREPAHYPFFAKPIDGKYSLAVLSADAYDAETDQVCLRGEGGQAVESIANEIISSTTGFLIQRRLEPHPDLARAFGLALWSARLIVLITASGPIVHRCVAKIATGTNPADNFWRPGNLLGNIDLKTGTITRAVRGTAADTVINPPHPDTAHPIVGTVIPDWQGLLDLVATAARVLPGIRTQSWDVALTDTGPVLLEVNFGGDLNLPQLASGEGMLDQVYRKHLLRCGYRF